MLQSYNITVYRLDFGYNECPRTLVETIPAGYSGYFFVPRDMKARGLRVQRLKKYDPPFDRVLKFLVKHSEAAAAIDVNATFRRLESTVWRQERWRLLTDLGRDPRGFLRWLWGSLFGTRGRSTWGSYMSTGSVAITLVIGASGVLIFRTQRSGTPLGRTRETQPQPAEQAAGGATSEGRD